MAGLTTTLTKPAGPSQRTMYRLVSPAECNVTDTVNPPGGMPRASSQAFAAARALSGVTLTFAVCGTAFVARKVCTSPVA